MRSRPCGGWWVNAVRGVYAAGPAKPVNYSASLAMRRPLNAWLVARRCQVVEFIDP